MVLVHVRQSEKVAFLVEVTTSTPVSELTALLVSIHSEVTSALRLAEAVATAAGTFESEPQQRHIAEMLTRAASEARATISPEQAERRIPITLDAARGATMLLRDAALRAFEGQADEANNPILRAWNEAEEKVKPAANGSAAAAAENMRCWWAGKEMGMDKTLGEIVGRNEKTKVVVKLGRPGMPPPREEDAAEKLRMMAELHRRQAEAEKLAEEDSDSFLNSAWADPKGLKKQMAGLTDVSWRTK